MKKNQILLLLIVFIGIISCKDEEVKYPVTYTSGLISDKSIKVYTKDGEVTSSNAINSILNRYKLNFSKIENGEAGKKMIATYLSEDSVELTVDNTKENKLRAVHEKNGIIYWEKQDTAYSGLGYGFSIENLHKYHPFYYLEYKMQPPNGLFLTDTKFKECIYIHREGGRLKIPMVEFVWKHNGYERAEIFLAINNSFSKEGLANLFVNDTILVQQYLIEFN